MSGHEVVVVEMRVGAIDAVNFSELAWDERFAFIEAPDALQEPLAAQHFVQTGDATSEAVSSIDRSLHAQRWANEWLGEVIMLYDWAKAAGMKTIYFGRIFKRETGQRPMDWLNERRL
jgi:AraC-like DNA-binding protein